MNQTDFKNSASLIGLNSGSFIIPEEIKADSQNSKYYQIYLQLKKELVLGKYNRGERFFSLRELRKKYIVDIQTIRSAISLLVKDGLLTLRPASGIYVGAKSDKRESIATGNLWFCIVGNYIEYPFYHSILTAVQLQASKLGMRTVYRCVVDLDDFSNWFSPEPGDGLIITGDLEKSFMDKVRRKNGIRYVVVGNYDLPDDIPCVRSKVSEAVFEGLKIASAAGHRQLGVILNPSAKQITSEIIDSVQLAVKDGLIEYKGAVWEYNEDGYMGMSKLKNLSVDCVLIAEVAFLGLSRYVLEHRIRCPEDLFVIRIGKNEQNRVYDDIAAVNMFSDKDEIARKALQALFYNGKTQTCVSLKVINSLLANPKKESVNKK